MPQRVRYSQDTSKRNAEVEYGDEENIMRTFISSAIGMTSREGVMARAVRTGSRPVQLQEETDVLGHC